MTLQVAAFATFTYLSACFSRLHRLSAGNVLFVHTDGEHREITQIPLRDITAASILLPVARQARVHLSSLTVLLLLSPMKVTCLVSRLQ